MKSTGQLLKEHREKSGLTHAEVSLSTKISVRMLKALEAGDLETLPAPSFIRGFVRSYASYLKLDPDELVKMFNEEMAPPPVQPNVESPSDAPSSGSSEDKASSATTPEPKSVSAREDVSSQDLLNSKPSVLKKVSLGFALLGLITLITLVFQTVKKYEREGVVEDVPALSQIDPPESDAAVEADTSAEPPPAEAKNKFLVTETQAEPPKNVEPPKDQEPSTASLSASATKPPETPPKTPEVSKPEAMAPVTPEPSASPQPTQKPEPPKKPDETKAQDLVKNEPPKTEEPPVKPSPKADAKGISQEIIVEALDKVEITLRSASGQKQTMKLVPGAIHALRVQGSLDMELSDGGVVNIIHNGKDLGVVGDLGQPKRLTLP